MLSCSSSCKEPWAAVDMQGCLLRCVRVFLGWWVGEAWPQPCFPTPNFVLFDGNYSSTQIIGRTCSDLANMLCTATQICCLRTTHTHTHTHITHTAGTVSLCSAQPATPSAKLCWCRHQPIGGVVHSRFGAGVQAILYLREQDLLNVDSGPGLLPLQPPQGEGAGLGRGLWRKKSSQLWHSTEHRPEYTQDCWDRHSCILCSTSI